MGARSGKISFVIAGEAYDPISRRDTSKQKKSKILIFFPKNAYYQETNSKRDFAIGAIRRLRGDKEARPL